MKNGIVDKISQTPVLIVMALFLFVSCESESSRILELRQKIEAKKQALAQQQKSVNNLSGEMRTLWLRSLKYRFPAMQPIVTDEVLMDLGHYGLPFIKSVRFQYLKNHLLKLTCTYQSEEEKVRPVFTLYLFDQDGVNIHKETIHYTWYGIKANLPRKKSVPQDYRITVTSQAIPYYFLIQKTS